MHTNSQRKDPDSTYARSVVPGWLRRLLAGTGVNRNYRQHHHAGGIGHHGGCGRERDIDGYRFAFGGHRNGHVL